jgi:hypothetical protein
MAWLARSFDRIFLDPFFAKTDGDVLIFYPFTKMGDGYELPVHREADIRRALRVHVVAFGVVTLWLAFVLSSFALDRSSEALSVRLAHMSWFVFLAVVLIYWRVKLARAGLSAPEAPQKHG